MLGSAHENLHFAPVGDVLERIRGDEGIKRRLAGPQRHDQVMLRVVNVAEHVRLTVPFRPRL